jgi:hypothetical protein
LKVRVKHTSRIIENLEEIRKIMNIAHQEFVATVQQYKKLAEKDINSEDLKKYVQVVFDIKDATKSKKIIPAVVSLFESGRGSSLAKKPIGGHTTLSMNISIMREVRLGMVGWIVYGLVKAPISTERR